MRRLFAVALVGIVIASSWWLYSNQGVIVREPQQSEEYRTERVIRGSIEGLVSGTGSLAPKRLQQLMATATGQVSHVAVSEGQHVAAGDLLFRLDDTDLQLGLKQAEAALRSSEAQLAKARTSIRDEEIAAAQAALQSAQANLENLRQGADATEIELARLAVDQAKNSLWGAQANRDAIAGSRFSSGAQKDQAEAQVLNAEVAVKIAELQYQQLLRPPKQSTIAAAEAQVAQAGANLAKLLSIPAAEDIALAEAQVEQAKVNVEIARERLDDVEFTAPFSGELASWEVHEGNFVTLGSSLGTLVDASHYHIDVSIDETEIGRIRVGQKVYIEIDAFPDRKLEGQVTKIDILGNNAQGIVTYGVRVELSASELALKPLMTAAIEIVVDRKENVLLVPNRALRRDKEGKFVEVLRNGVPTRVTVETGLTNDNFTEVLGGVEEGQEVIVGKPRANIFGPFGG